jgi:hypothetical protein
VKRLCLSLIVISLSACARAPESEIIDRFRAFQRAIEADDAAEARGIAPFLFTLPEAQKQAAIASLRSLAGAGTEMTVSRGSADTWLLRVSRGGSTLALVPFRRGAGGRWEMSPVAQQTQHIDVVPARR